jgi:hypothetical protein
VEERLPVRHQDRLRRLLSDEHFLDIDQITASGRDRVEVVRSVVLRVRQDVALVPPKACRLPTVLDGLRVKVGDE